MHQKYGYLGHVVALIWISSDRFTKCDLKTAVVIPRPSKSPKQLPTVGVLVNWPTGTHTALPTGPLGSPETTFHRKQKNSDFFFFIYHFQHFTEFNFAIYHN